MKHLTLCFLIVVSFCTSLAYASDCWITEETMGFKDWEALKLANATEAYKQATGDAKPQIKAAYQLQAEQRLVDLSKGEKAELLKISQLNNESVMQIRVGKKGIAWVNGIDLECR